MDALKGSHAHSSSQYLSMIDPAMQQEFGQVFRHSVFVDLNQDFEELIEHIQKSEGNSAEKQGAASGAEKKRVAGKKRSGNSRSRDAFRSLDNEEDMEDTDNNCDATDRLDLNGLSEGDDDGNNGEDEEGANVNENENDGTEDDYENYYDEDEDEDGDDDEDDDNDHNGGGNVVSHAGTRDG